MKKGTKILAMFLVTLVMASTDTGEIIFVDADANGLNDGSSWADAFNDLQDALTTAQYGDEIRVAQGIYTPAGPILPVPPGQASNPNPANGARYVKVTADLSWTAHSDATSHDVYFGTTFPGTFQGNQSGTTFDPGTMAYSTTYYWRIDEVNKRGETTIGAVWRFTTIGPGPSLPPPPPVPSVPPPPLHREASFQLINGVVIKGGYAGFGEPNPNARDIDLYETTLSGDIGTRGYIWDNCYHVVTGSETDKTAVLDGFTITEGNADAYDRTDPDSTGGGMYNNSGGPTVRNCNFRGNSARWNGGAMNNYYSSPTIMNCTFCGNSAVSNDGGAMNSDNSSPIIINCAFIGNSAYDWGGAIRNIDSSSPTISNCIFINNSADDGGAVFNHDNCGPRITNCTFSGNSARNGRAIGCDYDRYQNYVRLVNCILWDGGNEIWNRYSSGVNVTYSNVQGGWDDWGWRSNINANPWFARTDGLDNIAGTEDDNLRLLSYSPCIDAGDPGYVPEPNETDLDGKPRIIGSRIDMGAYEYHPPIPAEVRITPSTINPASTGRWITCYIWLPGGYDVADIDCRSPLIEYEIEPEQLWVDEKQQVVMARFSREEVQSILEVGDIELTIGVQLTDGTAFEGRDVIRVIRKGGGKLTKLGEAINPNPADGATSVSLYTAHLSWTTGSGATSHDVYFGTSYPPPFVCNQTSTIFDPGTMVYYTTYYWRIDEVNNLGKTTGTVWRFTTFKPPPGGGTGP